MDSRINNMGEESSKFVALKELKEERARLEKLPAPEMRKNRFDSWKVEIEKKFKARMKQLAQSMVQGAARDIASSYSEEQLLELTEKNLDKELLKMVWPPVVLQHYLSMVVESLEATVYSKESEGWNTRFQQIDLAIARTIATLPKPFSPSMINTEKFPDGSFRFPLNESEEDSRVFQLPDGRWCDRWLQKGLGEKKPIPLLPWERYVPYLERYKPEVYVPAHKKDQEALHSPATQKVEAPAPSPEPVISSGLREFFAMGREEQIESEADLVAGGRRPSRIYGGK